MTPCEKLGYKVGDRFVVQGSKTFDDGSIIELYYDDGTNCPCFKLVAGHTSFRCYGESLPGASTFLHNVKTVDPLTTTLNQAAEHDAKVKHHAAEHERLMQKAREMLPDGWKLVRDDEPEPGMDDPANWRVGDVLQCTDAGAFWTLGGNYAIKGVGVDGFLYVLDDEGDKRFLRPDRGTVQRMRFHSRP